MRFDGVRPGAIRLYPLSGPLCMLAMSAERHCQVDCCGPEAFVVTVEAVSDWVRTAGLADANEAVRQIGAYIAEMTTLSDGGYTGQVTSYDQEFNATWTPVEWIAWFRQWGGALADAIAVVSAEQAGGGT